MIYVNFIWGTVEILNKCQSEQNIRTKHTQNVKDKTEYESRKANYIMDEIIYVFLYTKSNMV